MLSKCFTKCKSYNISYLREIRVPGIRTLKPDFKMFILLYHLGSLILLTSGSSLVVDVLSGEHEDQRRKLDFQNLNI